MIRRLKKDVLSELPPKRRQTIQVECDQKIIKKISKIADKSKLKDINFDVCNINII